MAGSRTRLLPAPRMYSISSLRPGVLLFGNSVVLSKSIFAVLYIGLYALWLKLTRYFLVSHFLLAAVGPVSNSAYRISLGVEIF